jgi:hypothetical protein
MKTIYEIMDGIGLLWKQVLPSDFQSGYKVIPYNVDKQSSLGNYVDLRLVDFETTNPVHNEVNFIYTVGVLITSNTPLDSKKLGEYHSGTIAEMIHLYCGYHENDVNAYCLENGYHLSELGKVQIDNSSDTFSGCAMFELTIRKNIELNLGMEVTKFIKNLYDTTHGLGGHIELS